MNVWDWEITNFLWYFRFNFTIYLENRHRTTCPLLHLSFWGTSLCWLCSTSFTTNVYSHRCNHIAFLMSLMLQSQNYSLHFFSFSGGLFIILWCNINTANVFFTVFPQSGDVDIANSCNIRSTSVVIFLSLSCEFSCLLRTTCFHWLPCFGLLVLHILSGILTGSVHSQKLPSFNVKRSWIVMSKIPFISCCHLFWMFLGNHIK